MSRHHTLPAGVETCHWGFFDAALPPVLSVHSGDTVAIDTVSGDVPVLPSAEFEILPAHRAVLAGLEMRARGHILTGPIEIIGAKPGDVLEIRIEAIEPAQNWAYTVIAPLRGTLPEDFPMRRLWHSAIDRQRGVATLPWGQELKLAPFFGVMGTAPPPVYGLQSSIEPREYGGNMDLKELVAGSTLYLPVFAEGGLFSVGDGHGAQGDGEVCLTALETALTGRFRLILRPDLSFRLPRAETPTHWITMGFDPDLDDAAKIALREMIQLISAATTLAAEDAYMLCSLACDMRITQLVDGNKGVHAMVAKSLLEGGLRKEA
jgi:acetamidase/formamidase